MSLADVAGYFGEKLSALGYQEWEDEFNTDNIPRSLLERSFHMEIGVISGSVASHTCFTFDVPVTIEIFSCPTRPLGSSRGFQEMMVKADEALCSILAIEDRYAQSGILKVEPSSVEFEPLSASNDNVVKMSIEFGVQIKEEYRLT